MKSDSHITNQLKAKYDSIDQDLEVHLEGLLHSKPISYWDYIQTDVLLNLQKPRTDFPDEMVFIMYHQISELLFKMILTEIEQVAENDFGVEIFTDKIMRISRYFDVLTSSFSIMKDGMNIEQYNQFRTTLTPASGFQSAQYRLVEFGSTELINLIDKRFRDKVSKDICCNSAFEQLYWQAAGKDYKTGKKTYTLSAFEERYKGKFIKFSKMYEDKNLWSKYKALPKKDREDKALIKAMRHYDYTVNVKWVMAHYNTANHYLNIGGKTAEATGGSEWVKYMHPKYQKRIFFPDLWTVKEIEDWGINI
ncbi:tryptophan 2,3-dioxygenase family protein [Hyunsoonleella pacifica]|uniref:Tryptophan 2,3-dioxygenase n=1 Tax=Hyunsoonleella pacifica TaxID=1080224 RepID=A0A4V2JB15_9FLAO|nr:tryptophan 2,3-dioxygenase family protein [Hyunsoonleella pacifica]TBN16373.1 tryptophan 2,3-dioxygenase [Hyunsoonleella pacifica]GGD19996.1 tryptophan 2,3-dioxygenase [Hyunsoonleella pacifica]